ncbi:MAG: RagB/SusD family nutrient uptake outer membrane protein, partial [Mangrovibacterium sp.]
MKKLFMIFPGLFLFLFLACDDFLEEDNLSSQVASEYYETESGYETLINSCYSSLRTIYGDQPWLLCAGTDLYVEGRNTQPEGISEYRNLTSSDSYVKTFFSNLYESIQYCNTAVYYNDKTEETSSLAQRLAEVRFIRAVDYFELVQHFGGVAIVEDMIGEAIVEFSRQPAEDVYDFIISELTAILNDLPETTEEFGRVTQRAVYHYLAKVHLTRGYQDFAASDDFTTAASYAEKAIDGQGLDLTFEELFTPGNEENDEVIFSVQYDQSSMLDPTTDGNMQNYYFGPYLGGEGTAYGYPYRAYMLCPTMYVFDLFNEYDSRWEASFMTTVYTRYYDYYDQSDNRESLEVWYYYPQQWQLEDTATWRASSALRADATIIPYTDKWEASTASSADFETPIVKKFDDPTANFSGSGSSSRDIFLARLGETYLIAAEAYLKAGDVTNAAKKINVIRTRAAKTGYEAEMQLSSGEVDMDAILDERARELLGEYHRWEDLARTGTLVARTKLYNRDIKTWFDNGTNPYMGNDGKLKLLRPIPQDALDLNQDESYT